MTNYQKIKSINNIDDLAELLVRIMNDDLDPTDICRKGVCPRWEECGDADNVACSYTNDVAATIVWLGAEDETFD